MGEHFCNMQSNTLQSSPIIIMDWSHPNNFGWLNDCQAGGNHKDNEDEKSSCGADNEQEGDEIKSMKHYVYESADKSLPLTINEQMRVMFVRLMFSQTVVEKLVEE